MTAPQPAVEGTSANRRGASQAGPTIFLPTSRVRQAWDAIVLLAVVYNAVAVPFRLAFPTDTPGGEWLFCDALSDLLLIADIAVNFRTAFLHEGAFVTDPARIRRRYLAGRLWLDALSVLPLDWIALLAGWKLGGTTCAASTALRLTRLLRLWNAGRYLRYLETYARVNPAVVRIAKLTVTVSLLAHWVACCWFSIARHDGFAPATWVAKQGLDAAPTSYQYLRSLYWTLTTMTTVGYGDITPGTPQETVFTMLVMVLGASLFAYIIGNVSSLVARLDAAATAFQQKIETVTNYMHVRGLPPDLQEKILNYYDYLWSRNRGLDEKFILADLPSSLFVQVALFINREVIEKVPLFQGCDADMLHALVAALKPMVFSPGDDIIRRGELGRQMYFVCRGEVEVFDEQGQLIRTMGEGSFFGEVALLLSQRRTATVRAVTYCDLFALERSDFDHVLREHPEFAQSVAEIARERYQVTLGGS